MEGTFKGLCIFPLRLPPSIPVRFLHILPQIFRTESLVQEHPHQLFFGILGPQQITIKATSTMRIEPGGIP